MLQFEWDEKKHQRNLKKRELSFTLVERFFEGFYVTRLDDRKDYGEHRFISFGEVGGRVLCLVFTIKAIDRYRIISLRKANKNERAAYRALQERYEGSH